jgi:hypothetical protein
MKRTSVIIIALFFMAGSANGQKVNWEKLNGLKPDKVLISDSKPTKVLLLGTFHFAYPNLDGHKTDSSKFIDVLSPQRQKEIQELANVIKRFRPTRVYIESHGQSFHDSLYKEYVADRYKPGRNEVYQVAYRVSKQMGLPKLYCVDAGNFASSNYKEGNWIDSMWQRPYPVDSMRDKYWNNRYSDFYNTGDSIESTLTMLENFLLMAEPAVLARMHGHYLTGGFNTLGNEGPDILSMWWYNRNLRIFNNVLKTKPVSEDRIILLFGNGHIPILKHCFTSSPEFEVVELKSLLK